MTNTIILIIIVSLIITLGAFGAMEFNSILNRQSFQHIEDNLRRARREHNLAIQKEFREQFKHIQRDFNQHIFIGLYSTMDERRLSRLFDSIEFNTLNEEYVGFLGKDLETLANSDFHFSTSEFFERDIYNRFKSLAVKYHKEFIEEL